MKCWCLRSDGAFSLHKKPVAFSLHKNLCKTLDIYFSLTMSHFSLTVQNTRFWKMHESLTLSLQKKNPKKTFLPQTQAIKTQSEAVINYETCPWIWNTVRQFNSAITNQLKYLSGSILSVLMKSLPLVRMDYLFFSSYSKQENPLFLITSKLLNTFQCFKPVNSLLRVSTLFWMATWNLQSRLVCSLLLGH